MKNGYTPVWAHGDTERIWSAIFSRFAKERDDECNACNDWLLERLNYHRPLRLLNAGGGEAGATCKRDWLYDGLITAPTSYKVLDAMTKPDFCDLNAKWTNCKDSSFDVVCGSQVIEHLHNQRTFLSECLRVLEPGGTLLLTTENLSSLLNTICIILGLSPFSTLPVCGYYVGNKYSLHNDQELKVEMETDDPRFPGVSGHVRVFTPGQLVGLLEKVGFHRVKVSTNGLLPIIKPFSKWLFPLMKFRGHYLRVECEKPAK